jgi:hypothetical protein
MTWECLPIYAYDDIRHMLLFSSPLWRQRDWAWQLPSSFAPANKVLNAGGHKKFQIKKRRRQVINK